MFLGRLGEKLTFYYIRKFIKLHVHSSHSDFTVPISELHFIPADDNEISEMLLIYAVISP